MRYILIAAIFLLSVSGAMAQDEPKKFTARGYLKDMVAFNFYSDSLLFQNLVHNRLNFAWYPNEAFSFYAEFRTRLLSGDLVREIPNYSTLIDSNNDYFDLSLNPIDNQSVLLNTMVDRLYAQWTKDDWEVKLGRQRINWGVNLAWNPNDWFNAYSFFDFDYEERPGSDALRIIRYTGVASSVEVAAKMSEDIDNFVGAGMWRINKWNYDIQFLGGLAQGDIALGTGWAGNLGYAGFKGELTLFNKAIDTEYNGTYNTMFLGAVTVDYSFANSFYLNGSLMYNSEGSYSPGFSFAVVGVRPGTVRNLSPYRWSSFVTASYQFTPLLYGGLALISYPGGDSFFVNPSLTFSVVQNLDVDLIGQMFYGEDINGDFGSLLNAVYGRVKWSF